MGESEAKEADDEGRGEDGKRRQRWRGGFSTRREAQEALTGLLGDLSRGEYITPQRLTFGAFVRETWLPIGDATKARTTAEMYRRSMEKHVLPRIGGIYLQHLDAARLDRLYLARARFART